MRDVMVILHVQALGVAGQACANCPDYDVYVLDPALVDAAATSGLRNVKLLTSFEGPTYFTLDMEARRAALALEAGLDVVLRNDGQPVSVLGWQFLSLYYFFMVCQWYDALARWLVPRLTGCKVHIFRKNSPADYYFDSFMPSLFLVRQLKRANFPFVVYDYGNGDATDYVVPDLQGFAPELGPDWMLVHAPTVFYDAPFFAAEMQAAGKGVLALAAKRWHVPIAGAHEVPLGAYAAMRERLEPERRAQLRTFSDALRPALNASLGLFFDSSDFRDRQVEHLVLIYESQLAIYYDLQRYLARRRPSQLVLANHNAGFHGALIAYARDNGVPIVMLAHSKVVPFLEFSAADHVLALTHPVQAQSIPDARGARVRARAIAYPERFAGSSEVRPALRRLSLILNDISLNGIPFAPIGTYLAGVREFVRWCAAHDVQLKLRPRPGMPLLTLLSLSTGIDQATLLKNVSETMEEHVRDIDACVMYDMATSASHHFLRRGIAVLNATITPQTLVQTALVHPRLIPQESVADTLRRLDGFRSEPKSLNAFTLRQFAAYIGLFPDAALMRSCFRDDPPRASREEMPADGGAGLHVECDAPT